MSQRCHSKPPTSTRSTSARASSPTPASFPRPAGLRTGCGSSAQITRHYLLEQLIGRHVVAVVTFPPKQVGPFVSEVLVLGAYDAEGAVVLLEPERPVAPGSRIG